MIKIDLHNHSIKSPDSNITERQYKLALKNSILDCIAITDHNEIEFAQNMNKKLGDSIIVGEEIATKQGEIIGLFLSKLIEPNLAIDTTIKKIKSQGGLVYVPHPFETVRSGISRETLYKIVEKVDIIESSNGRAVFQNYGAEAEVIAKNSNIPHAASSDAHRAGALGKTFTFIESTPKSPKELLLMLDEAKLVYKRPSLFDVIAPKSNRLKKTLNLKGVN